MAHKEAFSNQHSEIAISSQHSAISQNQTPTTETLRHGEEKSLPRMHGKPGQVKAEEEERIRQRAEALVRRICETCDELDQLAEENPELVGRVRHGAEEHKDAYLRLKARLSLADSAPRCRWVRTDGTTCGSPQMKKHIYCFAHRQMMEARALALSLPALEDANAIMVGLMRIQKALIDDTISTKKAGLLLYSMQLALQTVGQVTFGQVKTGELVRETVDEVEAISDHRSAISENQTPTTEIPTPANQKPGLLGAPSRRHGEEESLPRPEEEESQGLPLMSTDDTEEAISNQHSAISQKQMPTTEARRQGEEKSLPRMGADDRGWGKAIKPVEWIPPADVFRMDTREGREAYEVSLRRKIRTSGDLVIGRSGDRTGDALQKLDIAQTCANVG